MTYSNPAPRFWAKVQVGSPDSCWIWIGAQTDRGYGQFWVYGERVYVHRWSYEQHVGPIPAGMVIDHLCRNHSCVNPAHLEPVTQRENILRGVAPTAKQARQTHCKWGHEFTPENVYPQKGRYGVLARRCRQCDRERAGRKAAAMT